MSRFVEIEEEDEDEEGGDRLDRRGATTAVRVGKGKKVLPPLRSTRDALLKEVDDEDEDEGEDGEVVDDEGDDNDPAEEVLQIQPGPSTTRTPSTTLSRQHGADTSTSPTMVNDASQFKDWSVLYPIYIDSERPYKPGCRRTPRRQGCAVPHPNAKEMAEAVNQLGFSLAYEPGKTHPRDWENPGRVRVLIKDHGRPTHRTIKNNQLLKAVAEILSRTRPPLSLMPPLAIPTRRRERIIYAKTAAGELPKRGTSLPEYSPAAYGTGGGTAGMMPPPGDSSAFGGLGAMLGGLAGGPDDDDDDDGDGEASGAAGQKTSKRSEKLKSKGKKKKIMVRA